MLRELVADSTRPAAVRVATLKALEALEDAQLGPVAKAALNDNDPRLRHEARRILLAGEDPRDAVKALTKTIESGPSLIERQGALALLAGINSAQADVVLSQKPAWSSRSKRPRSWSWTSCKRPANANRRR